MKKNPRFGSLIAFATCLAVWGAASVASAQIVNAESPHHDWLDAKAAQKDILRLQADRRRALKYRNWSKVAQDERLIKADELWLLKYRHRLHHSG